MSDDEIKVRIAVAVDHNGRYSAGGGTNWTDDDSFDWLLDDLQPGEARYFIDATLRKPKPKLSVLAAEPDSITEVKP